MKNAIIVFTLLFIIAISNLLAQSVVERPKLGLVLSGGGAKGMAHIGVIKAMEDAGLYPDYITGTSMGSIIGALYAIGYSADEIKEIYLGIKWETILTNDIPLDKVAFEEKAFYGRYFIELPIQDKKIDLPQGLIEGQELTMFLNKVTRSVHGISDFHDLPIPFECVATDIEKGEAVVLRYGSLPLAMRASMSIPTFFTPTLIDSTLFVDGGLLRNFPVQEVIDMGADIVIGVFVSNKLEKKEDLTSMVAVLAQSTFVFSAHDSNQQKKLVDIYIEPDLTKFSSGSFWSGPEIIKQGEKAGREYLEVFKHLADSLNKFGPVRIPKKLHVSNEYVFESILIEGNTKVPDELILGKLRIAEKEPIDIDELEKRINLLYGTLYFSKIFYKIDVANKQLVIRVKEAPPGSIKVAAHYDNDNKAGININLTSRNFLFPSSRFIMEYNLAQNPKFDLNYFKYLGKQQNMAMVFNTTWLSYELPGYWDENGEEKNNSKSGLASILKDNSLNSSFSFQGTYRSNVTFGIKFEYINHSITPLILDSINVGGELVTFQKFTTNDWGAQIYLKSNTFNKPYFPTKGIILDIGVNYIFDRNGYSNFKSNTLGDFKSNLAPDELIMTSLRLKSAIPIFEKLTFLYEIALTVSNGTDGLEDFPYNTFIGGSRPFGWSVYTYEATPTKRFEVLNYSAINLALQWGLRKNIYLTAKIDYLESEYPMKWISSSILTENIGSYPRRLGFSGKLSYNSLIGPIEIGIGKDQYLNGVHGFFGFGYYIKQ